MVIGNKNSEVILVRLLTIQQLQLHPSLRPAYLQISIILFQSPLRST